MIDRKVVKFSRGCDLGKQESLRDSQVLLLRKGSFLCSNRDLKHEKKRDTRQAEGKRSRRAMKAGEPEGESTDGGGCDCAPS